MEKRDEVVQLITIDGLLINYEDNSWLLFKPSGIELIFRVYSESSTQERVK
jgi:phosphomannomutase